MIAGLTGGIGSGKSMAARVFEILGCAIFNSDKVAGIVYFEPQVREKVIALLGPESYKGEKELNKPFIAKQIFGNETLRLSLNNIIHPAVGERFNAFARQNTNKIIIKETALLFEAGLEKQVDKIIVVTAPEELRIQRVVERDSLSREEVLRKIRSQLPESEKTHRADFIIYNNEKQFLITQVLEIYNKLQNV